MIDISKCKFEDSWVDDVAGIGTGTEFLWFNYPEEELFCGELAPLFQTEDYYVEKFGPVVSACLSVEKDIETGERRVRLSPTCSVDDGLIDVDYAYIQLKRWEIDTLVRMAEMEICKRNIAAIENRIDENMKKLKEAIARIIEADAVLADLEETK